MTQYLVGDQIVCDEDPGWSQLMEELYSTRARPRCMCVPGGVEMYTARCDNHIMVKRMPDTGSRHAPACESYEPPSDLSGLGQVIGTAIRQNVEDGVTDLRLAFSLSKTAGHGPSGGVAVEKGSVKTDGARLSLRGMLHYLWEEAGFHRWTPAMSGKRHWSVLRKYLLQAATDKRAKGTALSEQMYIPEAFSLEDKEAAAGRRTAQFARVAGGHGAARKLLVLIGEVNEWGPARYGYKVLVKHVPDMPFCMSEELAKRVKRRFAAELALWDAVDGAHLIIAGTFGVDPSGTPNLEEVCLMVVTKQWVPFDSTFEYQLLEALIHGGRRFAKSSTVQLAGGMSGGERGLGGHCAAYGDVHHVAGRN